MKRAILRALEWDVYRYILIVSFMYLTTGKIWQSIVSGFWLQLLLFIGSIAWLYLRFYRK